MKGISPTLIPPSLPRRVEIIPLLQALVSAGQGGMEIMGADATVTVNDSSLQPSKQLTLHGNVEATASTRSVLRLRFPMKKQYDSPISLKQYGDDCMEAMLTHGIEPEDAPYVVIDYLNEFSQVPVQLQNAGCFEGQDFIVVSKSKKYNPHRRDSSLTGKPFMNVRETCAQELFKRHLIQDPKDVRLRKIHSVLSDDAIMSFPKTTLQTNPVSTKDIQALEVYRTLPEHEAYWFTDLAESYNTFYYSRKWDKYLSLVY